MKQNQTLLIYGVFSLFYILSIFFKITFATETLNVLFIPLAFCLYIQEVRKINNVMLVIFLILFVNNAEVLFFQPNSFWSIFIYLITKCIFYLVLTVIAFKRITDFSIRRMLFSAVPIILLWLIYFNYSIKDLFGKEMSDMYIYYLVYSILLSSFLLISLISYFSKETLNGIHLIVIATCFMISGILRAIQVFLVNVSYFDMVVAFLYIVCYFFIFKFATTYTQLHTQNQAILSK
ncbi:hypothetical protein ACG2LH_11945 [Zhouia sp. PK063]|uniref:hypothetical protein n=1 Tax=Zhouia sp. PK063 TaxID=3373602 RepID=UPI0037BB0878